MKNWEEIKMQAEQEIFMHPYKSKLILSCSNAEELKQKVEYEKKKYASLYSQLPRQKQTFEGIEYTHSTIGIQGKLAILNKL
jgi:hypothetical protein